MCIRMANFCATGCCLKLLLGAMRMKETERLAKDKSML